MVFRLLKFVVIKSIRVYLSAQRYPSHVSERRFELRDISDRKSRTVFRDLEEQRAVADGAME